MKQKKKRKTGKKLRIFYYAFGAVAILNAAMKEIKEKNEQDQKK